MATDLNASFNEQFMNINNKLKKRFMRKPNISEATIEFNALAIQCEHSEQPTFSGHAYIGAAKCENTAGNFLGEAEYYLAAARQFMQAEMKISSLKFYSPARENLEAAIGCYIQAINKYPEKSKLRYPILTEIANNLATLNHKLEAISYYEQALNTIESSNTQKWNCMSKLLDLNLQCERYEIALETANSLLEMHNYLPKNMLADIQIYRVLLSLIIELGGGSQAKDKKKESLKELFAELLNDTDGGSEVSCCNLDLRIKLQSITICCCSKDLDSLIELSADTQKIFNLQQQALLVSLIRKMETQL